MKKFLVVASFLLASWSLTAQNGGLRLLIEKAPSRAHGALQLKTVAQSLTLTLARME